ncbi:hypothetical protein AB1283_00750 [Bacillus sp. S13(2024)]
MKKLLSVVVLAAVLVGVPVSLTAKQDVQSQQAVQVKQMSDPTPGG